jgi:hypothetical protein
MNVYVVYAVANDNGERFALAAFTNRKRAEVHVRQCETAQENHLMSAAEILGVKLSISILTVTEGD